MMKIVIFIVILLHGSVVT